MASGGEGHAEDTPDVIDPRRSGIRRLLFAAQVGASALLIAYLVARVSPEDAELLTDHVGALRWTTAVPLALVVMATGAASVVASGARVRAIAARRGTDLSLSDAVRMNCLSVVAAVFVPLGLVGDGLRAALLVRNYRVTLREAVGIVVSDRVAGLAASCVVAIVGVAVAPAVPGAADAERLLLTVTILATAGIAVLLLVAFLVHRPPERGVTPAWRLRFSRFGVIDLQSLQSRTAVLTALVGQALEGVSAIVLVRLFGFDRPPSGYIAAASSFLPILEAIPTAFVGFGAREGALEYLLVSAGEPRGSGLVVGIAGVLIRLGVLALILLVTYRLRGRARSDDGLVARGR